MIWRVTDPQGDEAGKVKFDVVKYTRGTGLDIGCGPHKAFPHFIGVDSGKDTELFGIEFTPDNVVEDASYLPAVQDGQVDFVFSSHLLEHIEDHKRALAEWWRIIKSCGYLVLYLPHRDLYPNCGHEYANPDHKHDFVPADIERALVEITEGTDVYFDLVMEEVRDQDNEYSFLQVFQKREAIGAHRRSCDDPKPEKSVCISRFGGFGDMIMMSNILPQLKREGYHITVNTTPGGQSIIQHDPNVDDWLIVDTDQVPNHQLPLFWEALAKRYTKFIQLSESIEGTLLAMPGRASHMWPDGVRRVELNRNYLEWTSQLAELPYHSEAKFYASVTERLKAMDYLAEINRNRNKGKMIGEVNDRVFHVMWTLAGSSVHKFYPHQDSVVARILLDMPEAVIHFTGDEACQLLEGGWELEPRIHCKSGKLSIRDTLTLATIMDCVVGPETGVLNAVAFENNSKVIMLSHSSRENLTKHWLNTATLAPAGTACYPCHRLHYGMSFCHQDEATGAAQCQADINPADVYDAIEDIYLTWKMAQKTLVCA